MFKVIGVQRSQAVTCFFPPKTMNLQPQQRKRKGASVSQTGCSKHSVWLHVSPAHRVQ